MGKEYAISSQRGGVLLLWGGSLAITWRMKKVKKGKERTTSDDVEWVILAAYNYGS